MERDLERWREMARDVERSGEMERWRDLERQMGRDEERWGEI